LKREDVAPVARAREAMRIAAESEHRRLLYVAMTRAADRLVVCGATGERGKPPGCWYDLVHDALAEHASEEPADDGEGPVWRYRGTRPEDGARAPKAEAPQPAATRPEWLEQEAPREAPTQRVLAPSRADSDGFSGTPDRAASSRERVMALVRGELMHRLLQALPDIAPAGRGEAAQRYLAQAATPFADDERQRMTDQVLTVLGDARFAALFGPGSRAEVPIGGSIERGGQRIAVSGVIDRLAVTAGEVLIADFKTNRPAPRRLEEVPKAYLTQLALYRSVIAALYPGRTVRAVLVWTDVPDLMEISAALLDHALAHPHLPVNAA
jgi:ATP-dependent helicase/nuclease subunit A